MRASAAIVASASAQATNAGQARSGVETPTTVIPASPRIFARGSRRWIGLAGSPATPVRCSGAPLTLGAARRRVATTPAMP